MILICSPMCSVVEATFGLSRSMVATGMCVLAEMTLKVSPACTVVNFFDGFGGGFLVVVVVGVVVVAGCFVVVAAATVVVVVAVL